MKLYNRNGDRLYMVPLTRDERDAVLMARHAESGLERVVTQAIAVPPGIVFDPLNIQMPADDVKIGDAARDDIKRARESMVAIGGVYAAPKPIAELVRKIELNMDALKAMKHPICSRCETMHEPGDIIACADAMPENAAFVGDSKVYPQFDELGVKP